jgi:hypothetical protein
MTRILPVTPEGCCELTTLVQHLLPDGRPPHGSGVGATVASRHAGYGHAFVCAAYAGERGCARLEDSRGELLACSAGRQFGGDL